MSLTGPMPGTCTREPVPYLFFTGAENVVIPMVKVPSGVLRRAQIAWRPALWLSSASEVSRESARQRRAGELPLDDGPHAGAARPLPRGARPHRGPGRAAERRGPAGPIHARRQPGEVASGPRHLVLRADAAGSAARLATGGSGLRPTVQLLLREPGSAGGARRARNHHPTLGGGGARLSPAGRRGHGRLAGQARRPGRPASRLSVRTGAEP